MRKPRILHPILLAIYPVLHLYYVNRDQLPLSVIFVPGLEIAAIALGLWTLGRLVLRDGAKAGLLTSFLLVWFFSYGHVLRMAGSGMRQRYLLSLWALLLVVGVVGILRTRRNLLPFQQVLNVVSGALLALLLLNIGLYTFGARAQGREQEEAGQQIAVDPAATVAPAAHKMKERPPDIFYVILDSYAGSSTLQTYFQYDNSRFYQDLRQRGFYVAERSHSNYPFTLTSVPSSLNMDYLNALSAQLGPDSKDFRVIMGRIKNNAVKRFLSAQGYRCLAIDSPDSIWGTEFWDMLLQTTVLMSVGTGDFAWRRQRTLDAFQKIEAAAGSKQPTFVYAHIYCPHAPYVFEANGEPVRASYRQRLHLVTQEETRKLYTDQVAYISKRTTQMIDTLLAKSAVPPVIIVQADHGPRDLTPPAAPTDTLLQQYYPILNAYHLPHNGDKRLYDSISPVNSFRVVLDTYFGTRLPLLKDESYFCTYSAPLRFTNVTQRLHDLEKGRAGAKSQTAWEPRAAR
ncbi:MAG TPA: hypothetical protein VFB21_19445 [Chthonomonadaceae bacterium]|nr:hypothetical protein [Chthonomonadaceae bacterium]